jgi:hypothetical protein
MPAAAPTVQAWKPEELKNLASSLEVNRESAVPGVVNPGSEDPVLAQPLSTRLTAIIRLTHSREIPGLIVFTLAFLVHG